MSNWWDHLQAERFWCEVTDRNDVGSDLKAPQRNEAGQNYWSYSLIREVSAGDIVFHYSTREKAFVGASVAGGPMEERTITWVPHGTVGRSKDMAREPRPGYWRPLYGYQSASKPLYLTSLEEPAEALWLRSWIGAHKHVGALRLPFQIRKDGIRGGQGYLFKIPADFVDRWPPLWELAERLDERAEEISSHISIDQIPPTSSVPPDFRPKSDADYTAIIASGVQRRSRKHERLVREAGQWLRDRGVVISNRHPKDLELISPVSVIVEAKIVGTRDPLFAVREALGQLEEYRYFVGPQSSGLAILLDAEPPATLVRYSEEHLEVAVLWLVAGELSGGPLAKAMILTSISAATSETEIELIDA